MPSFWDEAINSKPPGPFMSLFLTKNTPNLAVGISTVNNATGESWVQCENGLEGAVFGVVEHAIMVNTPSKILLTIVGPSPTTLASQAAFDAFLARLVKGCGITPHHDVLIKTLVKRPSERETSEILTRAFPNTGMLSSLAFSTLDEVPNEAISSFTQAIQFIHDHDSELILGRLRPPHMILGHESAVRMSRHAFCQLNITDEAGLAHLLSKTTRTPAGRCMLTRRLLSPIYDITVLNQRLDRVTRLVDNRDVLQAIQPLLDSTGDLERSFRRIMSSSSVSPTPAWMRTSLVKAISAAVQALSLCAWVDKGVLEQASHIQHLLETSLSSKKHGHHDGELGCFVVGLYPDIDALVREVVVFDAEMGRLAATLNIIAGTHDHFRATPCSRESDGGITSTALRLASLKRSSHSRTLQVKISNSHTIPLSISDLMSDTKPIFTLRHPSLDSLTQARSLAFRAMCQAQDIEWAAFIQLLIEVHAGHMHDIIESLADLDVCAASACNAIKMHHSRPIFVPGNASRLDAKALRHPLIESMRHDAQFVPNDVLLDPHAVKRGMLLYGVNASGKSSLMKSVGLAVIMAQCGMYVASSSFILCPYRSICTRIGSCDDLKKGHSTFVVEMLELRDILNQASEFSLVIGDELCSGTEAISSQSIVVATLVTLHIAQSSFVFATHLHGLSLLPQIATLQPPLCIAHLGVRYMDNIMVYDRKLQEGEGKAVYGLEIAKGLDMPSAFLLIADQTRRHLMGIPELTLAVRSAYNSRVAVGACVVCGSTTIPRESHHIQAQATANALGFTGHFHKNRAFNLAILCSVCHDDVHAGRVLVKGYIDTCEHGTILDIVR